METAPAAVEITTSLDNATIENLQTMRDEQNARLKQAHDEAVANASRFSAYSDAKAAQAAVRETFTTDAEAFAVACVDKDADPETYEKLSLLARSASVDAMSNDVWRNGKTDEHGKHSTADTTSGKAEAAALFNELGVVEPGDESDIPNAPENEPVASAETKLSEARTTLAELNLKMRRLTGNSKTSTRKTKELTEAYMAALGEYEAARAVLGGMLANELREHGVEGPQLLRDITDFTLDEMQKLTFAEATFLDEEKGLGARISRWLSQGRGRLVGVNLAIGAGIGFGTKALIAGAAGVGAAVALPAAIGAGVAVKTVKGVLNASVASKVHQRRQHDVLAGEDLVSLQYDLGVGIDETMTRDEMLKKSNSAFINTLHNRVHEDRRGNVKRMWIAAGAAALGGALGATAAEHLSFGHHSDTAPTTHPTISTETTNHDPAPGTTLSPSHSGEVAGFKTGATVEAGHGYTNELQDLAEQKGVNLSGSDAWEAYQHMNEELHGNFMHTAGGQNASYHMADGNWGIRPVGHVSWNPAALRDFNQFLAEHPELTETDD